MNLYVHLFFWVYSKQKNKYGRSYGIFSGSMTLAVVLFLIIMDLQIALEWMELGYFAFSPIPQGLIVALFLFGMNYLYFYRRKRYIYIEQKYSKVSETRMRQIRIVIVIILLLLVFFFFFGSNRIGD